MSMFKLPITLLKEIESILANFFWNDSNKNKIHWVAWGKMSQSKKDGGMGFPDLPISKIFRARRCEMDKGAEIGVIAQDYTGRCVAWRKAFHANILDPEHGEGSSCSSFSLAGALVSWKETAYRSTNVAAHHLARLEYSVQERTDPHLLLVETLRADAPP
ncbi:UNVERIFIED_CONTAM: hypothetical protein Sindi_2552900 [Sesamum indicum]